MSRIVFTITFFSLVIGLIKNLIDLPEKEYILKFSYFIDRVVNTKWGKAVVIFFLTLFIFLAAAMGTLMGAVHLLKKGSFLISIIPPFVLAFSTIPFLFITYQLLYKKDKQ